MNRSLEGVYRSLEPLRIYALRQGSHVDKELESYGEGFQVVEELFDEILAGAFAERQPRLPSRADASPLGFTPEGMRLAVLERGVEAVITEHVAEEAVTLRVGKVVDENLDLDRMKGLVLDVLSAHLECAFDYGNVTWDIAEARYANWDAWEAADLTWAQFDFMS